jgi:cellulose synthase/poly-beta-1,6-N-acetylglucosamine synthase-like glycosyltransferase
VIIWQFVFFFSLMMLFYIYAGYPVLVFLLGMVKKRIVRKKDIEPFITIVIPAYNEEKSIEATIKNKLELNYPGKKIEIIVVSDGSTDRTDEIVKQFATYGVKLIQQGPRAGKTSALNLAVPLAKGEIIIFSDANSIYDKDALKEIVANFADAAVGYVTGKMVYTNPDGSTIGDGCSAYMKYENFLRTWETNIGSIVGVDGGIDAVRKKLYKPMNPDQLPDFVLPLSVSEQGFRVVYEPAALLREEALQTSEDEYRMRVRVSLRALWALSDKRSMLFTTKNFLYAWQILSHKILRYLCFVFMLMAFVSNLVMFKYGIVYRVFFFLQLFVYLLAAISHLLERRGINSKIAYLSYYFTLINFAAGHAFVKFLMGKKQVLWNPRKG